MPCFEGFILGEDGPVEDLEGYFFCFGVQQA
jgi:hypothetical protein